MGARQNALSELTRFWLEARHGCFISESVPVPVPYAQSDIDFMAFRADGQALPLPNGDQVGPRLIVECKDEHDFDPKGSDFGKRLIKDNKALGDGLFIPAAHPEKIAFSMLKEQHFRVAETIFGTSEFDRLFIVHALSKAVRSQLTQQLREKRIYWMTVAELIGDLQEWYRGHKRPAGLRHTVTGDIFHLLFGYCGVQRPAAPSVAPDHTS